MIHDLLCMWSTNAIPDPLPGYDCGECDQIKQVRKDMITKGIAAIEAIPEDMNSSTEWDRDYDIDPSGNTRNPRIWIREAVSALRLLEEKS